MGKKRKAPPPIPDRGPIPLLRDVPRSVLFFDTATETGWAFAKDMHSPRTFGHFTLPHTHEEIAPFLFAMKVAVHELIVRFNPYIVGYESPLLRPKDHPLKLRKLYGLANKVEEVAYDFNIKGERCVEATVGEIRTHFLGRGYPRDSKRAKIAVCNRCRSFGWGITTDDEADALAGLDYVLALQSPAAAIMRTPLFMKANTDDRRKEAAEPGHARPQEGLEVGRRPDAPRAAAPRARAKRQPAITDAG